MGHKVLDSDFVTGVVIARLSFHLNATVGDGDCCAPGLVPGTGRATNMILTGFLPSKSSESGLVSVTSTYFYYRAVSDFLQ